jgi:hypothetical protein
MSSQVESPTRAAQAEPGGHVGPDHAATEPEVVEEENHFNVLNAAVDQEKLENQNADAENNSQSPTRVESVQLEGAENVPKENENIPKDNQFDINDNRPLH